MLEAMTSLEAMAAFTLAIVGAILFLFVLFYCVYIIFYPLSKTVTGGIEAAKTEAAEKRLLGEKKPEPTVATNVLPQEE